MNSKKISLFVFVNLLCLLITACIPKADNLDQKTYMLTTPQTPLLSTPTNKATLQVNETNIVSAFSDNTFTYRTSDLLYQKDYYNLFFTPPNQEINDILFNTLKNANLFTAVEHGGSLLKINYILKSNISELYADYRNPSQPQAVLVLDITLYQQKNNKIDMILQRRYQQIINITPQNSEGLVLAWNKAIVNVLPIIIQDIDHAVKKSSHLN